MPNDNQKRVLGRVGAHELTEEQTQEVSAGLSTLLSVIRTNPGFDVRLDS
jgi:hypothetical protein